MNRLIALSIGGQEITAPTGVPVGGLDKFNSTLGHAIDIVLIFLVALTVGFIIFGGIKWITAGGDKTKVASARGTLTYAIIGLVLAFSAFMLVNILGKLVFGGSLFCRGLLCAFR